MTSPKIKKPVSLQHINSWRMYRQYLDRSRPARNPVDIVNAVGWIYSPGCSTPYLALWARMSSFKSTDLDKLVFREQKLVQLETLRGCTMLVPKEQAVVAMRIRSRTFTELAKQAKTMMPVTDAEMERLKSGILETLQGGEKTMHQLLRGVPANLVRDFGPDLKRIGLTNSLSLALSLVREEGKVLKIQSGKRLDSTDYSYTKSSNVVPESDPMNFRFEEACALLATQYFRGEAPARVKDFAWWAGINVTDAIRAAGEVKPRLTPIAVEGTRDEFLISESDIDEFLKFTPDPDALNFIPYRDTFLKGQREIVDRFVRREHADKPFSRWKGKLINDPLATIVRNGQVIGVWEWNDRTKEVDSLLFEGASDKAFEKAVQKRAGELAAFIGKNLGEIRLQGLNIGPHQMTCIHDLKAFWGRGAQADVHV